MNSKAVRLALGLAVVAVAIVLFVVLKSGDGESTTGKAPQTLVIRNGKPVGGIAKLTYNRGERVRFTVRSDVADEIHIHGYDLMKDVRAGGSVSFDFPATIEGVFEGELENRGEQILELRVNP